jgi:hypothetical protein
MATKTTRKHPAKTTKKLKDLAGKGRTEIRAGSGKIKFNEF